MTVLLTEDEVALIEVLSDVSRRFAVLVHAGGGHVADFGEVAAKVHDLQNWVLAQAAARAFPDRFRLMGANWDTIPRRSRFHCGKCDVGCDDKANFITVVNIDGTETQYCPRCFDGPRSST